MPRRNVLIQVQSQNQWVKPPRRYCAVSDVKSPGTSFRKGLVSVTNTSSRRSTSKLMTIQNCLVRTTHTEDCNPLSSSFSRKTWEPSMVILCKNHEALPGKTIFHPTLFCHFHTPPFQNTRKNWGTKKWEAKNLVVLKKNVSQRLKRIPNFQA